MKTILWVALFLCASMLSAEVLFYDDFNRVEGAAVGNGWVNFGPVNPVIENGSMKIVSSSLQGVRRDFTSLGITSGIYYISYDWKITSNSWLADAFPNGTITYLRHDYEGNLYYDNTSDFSDPFMIGTLPVNTWANIKLKVNLSADVFSLRINGSEIAQNIPGLAVSDFVRFTFRAGTGSNVTQYIDNFAVFNDTPPSVPTSLAAIGAINDISLSWGGTSVNMQTYRIYRSTNSFATELLDEVPGTQVSYVDNTAAPNTDYYYRVKAVSLGIIESDYSNEVMSHLQPSAYIEPTQITLNVGYGYSDTTYTTIHNNGNYPLNWHIASAQTGEVPSNGLVAYYPFNGNTSNEAGLHQYDAINSGANYTADRQGNPNKALDFNGINSYLFFNENILFNNEMSISCWVFQRSVAYAPGIVSRYMGWSLFGRVDDQPGVRFYSFLGAGGSLEAAYSFSQWHHVVVTANQSICKMYIDGVLIDQDISVGVSNTGENMFIGRYFSGGYYWDGKIDDIAIYNRPLNQDEIQDIFTGYNSDVLLTPYYGSVLAGQQQQVSISVDTQSLNVGTYVDNLYVLTNDSSNSSIPMMITLNVLPLPPAPEDLAAVGELNCVNLTWTNPPDADIIAYRIYRGTSSPAQELLAEIPGTASNFTDTSAMPNADYYYRIRSVSSQLIEGNYSIEVMSHLQSQLYVNPQNVDLFVGVETDDSETITIGNSGNYTLHWNVTPAVGLPIMSGLKAFYPLDANADDISGNNCQGTPYNCQFLNNSCYFNGSDSRIVVPDTEALHFTNSITIAAKINFQTGGTDSPRIVSKETGDYTPGFQLFTLGNTNNRAIEFVVEDTYVCSTQNLHENQWYEVVATYDGNIAKMYIDGVSDIAQTIGSRNLLTTSPMSIGIRGNNQHDRYKGFIDALYLYDVALTQSDVQSLFQTSPANPVLFSQTSGEISTGQQQEITISLQRDMLVDGVHTMSFEVIPNNGSAPIELVVNYTVDLIPPLAVANLALDALHTDANQIGITWSANAVEDSVDAYKIYRRGRDEAVWRLLATVPGSQLSYIDAQFTGLDSTFVYYRVLAVDWIGNLGAAGEPLIAALERFLAPDNVQLVNVGNRDILISWNPVTQTISGLPAAPSCYIIYKSQYPTPLAEFDFLSVSFEEEFTHQWALYFQPLNRLFYVVTAYGGDMVRMDALIAKKHNWKYGELENALRDNAADRVDK